LLNKRLFHEVCSLSQMGQKCTLLEVLAPQFGHIHFNIFIVN